MPRKLKVPPLKGFALRTLSELAFSVWPRLKENLENTEEVREYFQFLPITLRYSLLDAIRLIHLHAVHIKVLFCHGMNRLDLSRCIFSIDQLILWSGPYFENLSYLKLPIDHHIPPKAFIRLIEAIPNIQVLTMCSSGCNNNTMDFLSLHCPKLKDLNVSTCPITDKGIQYLCADDPPRCSYLIKLCITTTKVTQAGVAELILKLPNLQDVDFDGCMFEVLNHMCSERKITNPLYNLKVVRSILHNFSLYSKPSMVSQAGIKSAIEKCPHLTHLVIGSQKKISRDIIDLLCQVPKLTYLNLDLFSSRQLTYKDILPILSYHCPTLAHLTLKGLAYGADANGLMLSTQAENSELLFSFPSLISMILIDSLWDPLIPNVFVSLLQGSPKLEKLELCFCLNFTDSVLEKILLLNPLKNLKEVYLQECDRLTMKAIFILLQMDNPLDKLFVNICNNITFLNMQDAYDYIRDNNLDVDVTFV